jgi:hypothetical protein
MEPPAAHRDRLTFALLFRPDVTKMNLESEAALLLREVGADTAGSAQPIAPASAKRSMSSPDSP